MDAILIGEVSGKVWQRLQSEGKTALRALEKEMGYPPAVVHMALGWLAREGKIQFAQEKRTVFIWLTETS